MSNKESAVSFLQMAAVGDIKRAYEKFIAADFIHHNQYFKGDRQSLMVAMEEASQSSPNKALNIKNVYEDGNTVITLSEVIRKNPTDSAVAVVHIFRFINDKVVELWDLGQVIDPNSPNENGVF